MGSTSSGLPAQRERSEKPEFVKVDGRTSICAETGDARRGDLSPLRWGANQAPSPESSGIPGGRVLDFDARPPGGGRLLMAWECDEWEALHDRMPGKPPTVHVTGACTFPTSGFKAELRYHEPQGINPADLLLDLLVTEPTGPVNEVMTRVEVEFRRETDFKYETATIIDYATGIPVKEVS